MAIRDWILNGALTEERVVFSRRPGPPTSQTSGSTGRVSVIKCISASSESLRLFNTYYPAR